MPSQGESYTLIEPIFVILKAPYLAAFMENKLILSFGIAIPTDCKPKGKYSGTISMFLTDFKYIDLL